MTKFSIAMRHRITARTAIFTCALMIASTARLSAQPTMVVLVRHAEGTLSARDATLVAFARAVGAMEASRDREATRRVVELAALYESYGRSVPFDVQTRFWQVTQSLSPADRQVLQPAAQALGFSARQDS